MLSTFTLNNVFWECILSLLGELDVLVDRSSHILGFLEILVLYFVWNPKAEVM